MIYLKFLRTSWPRTQFIRGIGSSDHRSNIDASVFSATNRQTCMNYLQEYAIEYSRPFRALQTDRSAAVLLPFCVSDSGKASVLLTVRSSNVFRYRGLICFPGGITDPEDRDATHTALRETHEELGVAEGDIEVWGPLHPFPSLGTRILVTPVIGVVRTRSPDIIKDLCINTEEVERAFLLSLESLCDPKTWRYTMYSEVKGYQSPVFVVDGLKVWGLTGRLLHLALKGLVAEHYKRDYPTNVLKVS